MNDLEEEHEEVDTLIRSRCSELNQKCYSPDTRSTLKNCKEKQVELLVAVDDFLRNNKDYKLPVFTITHPHGRMKHVTIGEYLGWDGKTLRYSSATCAGCSGGPVWIVWLDIAMKWLGARWNTQIGTHNPHSGSVSNTEGCSCGLMYWRF